MDNYEDIINLPHYRSTKHPPMSLRDRAAQFAPFAALKGYDEAVTETARLTDVRRELSEYEIAQIDYQLQYISDNISKQPQVTITYFVADDKKEGGEYISTTGIIKKIDDVYKRIIFTDKIILPIKDIMKIEIK